jgi:hypothetical protein
VGKELRMFSVGRACGAGDRFAESFPSAKEAEMDTGFRRYDGK